MNQNHHPLPRRFDNLAHNINNTIEYKSNQKIKIQYQKFVIIFSYTGFLTEIFQYLEFEAM